MKIWQRFKTAFGVRGALLVDFLAMTFIPKKKGEKVLLIRLDAIGDFLLFRETMRKIRFSEKFENEKFVLCGNIAWKELFEAYERDLSEECIWIDRQKMLNNFFYRFSVHQKIRSLGIATVIEPTFSRMYLLGDAIARVSGAEYKIANSGNTDNTIPKEKKIADQWYDFLIPTGENILFERERNFIFAEKLLNEKISREIQHLPLRTQDRQNQIVLFVGASESYKIWHFANFGIIGKKIFNDFNAKIILAGSLAEKKIAEQILVSEPNTPFTDLTGKTNLCDLAEIIANSKLLVTNETAAAHFGAFTKTPTLCIANGRHFGRFSPYPDFFTNVKHIFPPKVELLRQNFQLCAKTFCNSPGENIDDIKTEIALKIARELYENCR